MNTPKTFTVRSQTPKTIWLKESGSYRVILAGEGCDVSIRGAWQTHGTEKVEILLDIIHAAPHTHSNTLLRGVAYDRSQFHLSGTIIVEKSAQHTNAFLTENILLLSPHASAHALPNLEILANEVKCSHAATVTKIPEEHIFYLQSRGLTRKEAEAMIVSGFLALA